MGNQEIIEKALQEKTVAGKISCAQIFKISEELNCSVREIGQIANKLNVKIINCQIGCF